jgi:hypothetical protein
MYAGGFPASAGRPAAPRAAAPRPGHSPRPRSSPHGRRELPPPHAAPAPPQVAEIIPGRYYLAAHGGGPAAGRGGLGLEPGCLAYCIDDELVGGGMGGGSFEVWGTASRTDAVRRSKRDGRRRRQSSLASARARPARRARALPWRRAAPAPARWRAIGPAADRVSLPNPSLTPGRPDLRAFLCRLRPPQPRAHVPVLRQDGPPAQRARVGGADGGGAKAGPRPRPARYRRRATPRRRAAAAAAPGGGRARGACPRGWPRRAPADRRS